MQYFFLAFFLGAIGLVGALGFRGSLFERPPIEVFNDMDHQAKIKAQSESAFFADGVGARRPAAGTLPMGFSVPEKPLSEGGHLSGIQFSLPIESYFHTGRFGEYYGDGFPQEVKVSEEFIEVGKLNFNIYCAICHGKSGNGQGVLSATAPVPDGIVPLSALPAANLHEPRFSDPATADYRPNGEVFEVISVGRGLMGGYGGNIPVNKRWAIIAYLRSLQKIVTESTQADNQESSVSE